MSIYPEADALLAGPLGGWLAGQGKEREAAKKQANERLYICTLIGLPALAFMWILAPFDAQLKMFVTAGVGMGTFFWSRMPINAAKKKVKIGINDAIADAMGLTYYHDMEPGRGFARAKTFAMLPRHHRDTFEDGWAGDYAGHPFVLHEAHLKERRGSGKNRRYVTVFQGAIITIGFGRDFLGTTLVQRSGKHRKLFGGVKDSINLGDRELQFADMVHPGFEDTFNIFTTDQMEARYLVNPVYVERLIAIEKAFDGDDIRCLFADGELVIVIDSGNLFESGSIEASDDRMKVKQTIEQFAKLADLTQALNQSERGAEIS